MKKQAFKSLSPIGVMIPRMVIHFLVLLVILTGASISQAQTSRSAATHYNRGSERYDNGDLDGAIADFDKA